MTEQDTFIFLYSPKMDLKRREICDWTRLKWMIWRTIWKTRWDTGAHSYSFDSTQIIWPVLKLGNYLRSSRSDIISIYQTTFEDGGFKLTNQDQMLTIMDLCISWIEVRFDILSILAIMEHSDAMEWWWPTDKYILKYATQHYEAMWRNNQTGMRQYKNDEEQLTSYAFLPRSRAAFNRITAENKMFIKSSPKSFGNDWLFLLDPSPIIAMKMSLENWIFLLTFS